MCKIFICILENIDFANFVATSILSLILVVVTIIISWRQNRLQKDINKQQEQLQTNIVKQQIKVNLYQHRIDCYVKIMQALGIMKKQFNLVTLFEVIQKNIDTYFSDLSKGTDSMNYAFVASESLFDTNTMKYIQTLYLKYHSVHDILRDCYFILFENASSIDFYMKKNSGITNSDTEEMIIMKKNKFMVSDVFITYL
jgi:hypothetical protein